MRDRKNENEPEPIVSFEIWISVTVPAWNKLVIFSIIDRVRRNESFRTHLKDPV